jgi:membrane protein DedA with SNARE-associated domain
MYSIFLHAADFLSQHKGSAGMAMGLVTLLESLAVVGALVPATALMVVAGGLIAAGILDPVSVILCCVIGAVAGDAISYLAGRNLGSRALRHPMLAAHRRAIARTRLYCRRYGVALIYVGRFFGPLRGFVPVVVGILQMRQAKFQAANIVSAIIWVPVMLAPGYLAAKGLANIEMLSEADPLTLGLIGLGVLSALGVAAWRLSRIWTPQRPRNSGILVAAAQ